MKLVSSNGKILEVRDAGPVIFRLTAGVVPIKFNGKHLMEDDAARDLLRDLLALEEHEGGKVVEEQSSEN